MNDKVSLHCGCWRLSRTTGREKTACGVGLFQTPSMLTQRLGRRHNIWDTGLYGIKWPRREHFTVCSGVTNASHSVVTETVFLKRKCTGGAISAHCSTEFTPGNSSQMICLHKCVKCALKSAALNCLAYIFQWMKASFLRTSPGENYKPQIYPKTYFKGDIHSLKSVFALRTKTKNKNKTKNNNNKNKQQQAFF